MTVWQTRPLVFLWDVLRPKRARLFTVSAFYMAGQSGIWTFIYLLGRSVSSLEKTGTVPSWFLFGMIGGLIAYEGFYRIGHSLEVGLFWFLKNTVRHRLLVQVERLHFRFFTERTSGELVQRVTQAAESADQVLTVITNNILDSAVMAGMAIALLSHLSRIYGIAILAWAAWLTSGQLILIRYQDTRARRLAAEEARTAGAIGELQSNIRVVKVYGQSEARRSIEEQIEKEKTAYFRFNFWEIISAHFTGTSILLLGTAMITITAWLWPRQAIDLGSIAIVASTLQRLITIAWETRHFLSRYVSSTSKLGEHLQALDAPHEFSRPAPRQSERGLVFDNVGFHYVEGKPVLRNFSLAIAPGEKIGLVGASGAGKSTLFNLLLRFYDPAAGEIRLDGLPLHAWEIADLRKQYSYVPQESGLFSSSILKNLTYGRGDIGSAEVEAAAQAARAHDFIVELPEGYETPVGERGMKLSGGQAQRMGLARALVANRSIFLFDEATSALDSASERLVQAALPRLMSGKTVITIAHRLSTLRSMDRLIVLQDGAIREEGTHDALLERNGLYRELWETQTGQFRE